MLKHENLDLNAKDNYGITALVRILLKDDAKYDHGRSALIIASQECGNTVLAMTHIIIIV